MITLPVFVFSCIICVNFGRLNFFLFVFLWRAVIFRAKYLFTADESEKVVGTQQLSILDLKQNTSGYSFRIFKCTEFV